MATDAAGSSPNAAGPVLVGSREGAVGEGGEVEAPAFRDGMAGVGLDGGPDRVGAVVDEGHDEAAARVCCGGERGEGKESEEEREKVRERDGRHYWGNVSSEELWWRSIGGFG